MSSVYREKGRKTWTVAWYDSTGKRSVARGIISKTLAETIGQQRDFNRQAAEHGVIDRSQEKQARHAGRDMAAQLKDFRAALVARKRSPVHVNETINLATRVFALAGINRIEHIDRHKVHVAAGKLEPERAVKGGKLSHRSMSKALTACKNFCAWLVEAERLPYNPLAKLKGWDPEQDRRRTRLILTEEQTIRLIEVTASQPVRGGMTGMDRMMRYALGIGTGFRQGTLFKLKPEDFHLDSDPPFIRTSAIIQKNRKAVDHPIGEELKAMLLSWLPTRKKGKPIFPKDTYASTIIAYRHDLAAAGIQYHDEDTDVFCDQHAQRGTFITGIIRAAGLKAAQDLAHHSTPLLTSNYGQLGMDDYAKALAALPKLKRAEPGQSDRKIG